MVVKNRPIPQNVLFIINVLTSVLFSTDVSTGSASYLPATAMSFPLSGPGFTSGVKVSNGERPFKRHGLRHKYLVKHLNSHAIWRLSVSFFNSECLLAYLMALFF